MIMKNNTYQQITVCSFLIARHTAVVLLGAALLQPKVSIYARRDEKNYFF